MSMSWKNKYVSQEAIDRLKRVPDGFINTLDHHGHLTRGAPLRWERLVELFSQQYPDQTTEDAYSAKFAIIAAAKIDRIAKKIDQELAPKELRRDMIPSKNASEAMFKRICAIGTSDAAEEVDRFFTRQGIIRMSLPSYGEICDAINSEFNLLSPEHHLARSVLKTGMDEDGISFDQLDIGKSH